MEYKEFIEARKLLFEYLKIKYKELQEKMGKIIDLVNITGIEIPVEENKELKETGIVNYKDKFIISEIYVNHATYSGEKEYITIRFRFEGGRDSISIDLKSPIIRYSSWIKAIPVLNEILDRYERYVKEQGEKLIKELVTDEVTTTVMKKKLEEEK